MGRINFYLWATCTWALISTSVFGGSPNVFGKDHRVEVTSEKFPWRAVGRLDLPNGSWCTATLVGEDLILTAAHCVIDEKKNKLVTGDYVFKPGYRNGKWSISSAVNRFWWGTDDPAHHRAQDWAIGRIDAKLGSLLGHLGVDPIDIKKNVKLPKFTLAGYSGDFKAGEIAAAHVNCQFTEVPSEKEFVYHQCDMTRGASGASIFYANKDSNDIYVVALNVAEYRANKEVSLVGKPYTRTRANIAVRATEFVRTVRELQKN